MRLLKKLVTAFSMLGMSTAVVGADDKALTIAGAIIPKVFERGQGGPYEAFFDDVVAVAPVKTELKMLPVKRLARSFFEHDVDCMYMATDDRDFYVRNGTPLEVLATSKSFSQLYLLAYTRSDKGVVSNWASLEGASVAADQGIHASSIVQRKLPLAKRLHYTKTVDEAFEVMGAGRVDAVLAFHVDAEQYFVRTGSGNRFTADRSFPLLTLGEGLACWPSEAANKLVEYLNSEIDRLHASGALEERYGFLISAER